MAGHSKFANIKHRKGAQDAKRAKVFTRAIREVTVAAKWVRLKNEATYFLNKISKLLIVATI